MNSALTRLVIRLSQSISEEALFTALYVLRMPRHLHGLLPAAQQFQQWRTRLPAFNQLPCVEDYDGALEAIDAVATLEASEPLAELTGKPFEHFKNKWAPMYPLAGDSVIAEALVIQSADSNLHGAAETLLAWLTWQAQRFQVMEVSLTQYGRYLDGEIPRLKDKCHGSRLYNAYLAIAQLFKPSEASRLQSLSGWFTELSEDASLKLTLLLRVAELDLASHERKSFIRYGCARWGYTPESLRSTAGPLFLMVPRPVYTLLRSIWMPILKARIGKPGSSGIAAQPYTSHGGSRLGGERPEIRYTEFVLEMIARLDALRLHDGMSVTFVERAAKDPAYEPGDDDPDESGQVEPTFSLFMADSDDLIQGYYAAKGLQAAIEYRNAQLCWTRAILSEEALEAVLSLPVDLMQRQASPYDLRARLAIALSLITGRGLGEVAAAFVVKAGGIATTEHPVIIDLDTHRLHLLAGHPRLEAPLQGQQPLCHEVRHVLRLPLPKAWWPLVDAIGAGRNTQKTRITQRVHALLKQIDARYHVTASGIRSTFIQALAEQTHGDLGLQKSITDGVEANSQNIIHYAAYPIRTVEATWRRAAEALVGPLEPLPNTSQAWTGSEHPFDLDALARYFAEIRGRIEQACAARDRLRSYNLSTLYLAYWLQLGLALRKTLDPVPTIRVVGQEPTCWALVADKHRPDGSTDRVVPLGPALTTQIQRHLALTKMLGLSIPQLRAQTPATEVFSLRLHYVHTSGTVVDYRPSEQERHERLVQLPGNWGRKVVRSQSTSLPGRFRDAELGHWVSGRKPWDMTSTFDAQAFHAAWVSLQAWLEERLGFQPIDVMPESVVPPDPLPRPRLASLLRAEAPRKISPQQPEATIRDDLEAVAPGALDPLDAQKEHRDRISILDLARRAIAKKVVDSPNQRLAYARQVCTWLRTTYRVPLYATPPRPLLGSHHVLDAEGLQALMVLQREILPAIHRDWYRLPSNALETLDQRSVELGRLIVMGIWRLGLAGWPLIDAWLQVLHTGTSILAQGTNRYQIFRVVGGTARESVRRVVFLDPFTSSYLTIERDRIRKQLLAPLYSGDPALGPRKRRSRVETGLNRYLASLGVSRLSHPLTTLTQAATQRLMLGSAPLIAAYSCGRIVTEDLDDASLRRLAGLTLQRKTGSEAGENDLPASRTDCLPDESEPPEDVLDSSGLLRALRKSGNLDKKRITAEIAGYQPSTGVEALLKHFAQWLLGEQPAGDDEGFSGRGRGYFLARIKIVAFALLGYASEHGRIDRLDRELLEELQEISREHFPERMLHGAWFQFHAFLRDPDADHAKVEIGPLGNPPERAISARIFSSEDIQTLLDATLSVRSGIGNASLRQAARRHIELMVAYGMRRAESTALRHADQQGNVCRVQAYPGHRLKTDWADRILPLGFAPRQTRAWLADCNQGDGTQVVNPNPQAQTAVAPDNFYDALNRLIKQVTGDPDMGSHHLRHTFVSRMVLTLLRAPAALSGLDADFPWLPGLMIEPERMRVLLGSEGDAGQGLRALSALVGHSHPTTTLRHYTHVLCIALYGALRKLDTLDMTHSFENRIASRATVQRWAQRARTQGANQTPDAAARHVTQQALRDTIEAACHHAGIDRDETCRQPPFASQQTPAAEAPNDAAGSATTTEAPAPLIDFDTLERLDRSLRDGGSLVSPVMQEQTRRRLAELARIPSGKRGVTLPRHPLEEVREGVFLPQRLAAGTATQAAAALCQWLDALCRTQPNDFEWLLDKWKYTSERQRGWMRLDGPDEVCRAQTLESADSVRLEIRNKALTRDRQNGKPGTLQMRIKCVGPEGVVINRDTVAVRWMMSYVGTGVPLVT